MTIALSSAPDAADETAPATGTSLRLGTRRKSPAHRAAQAKVQEWVRTRFRLTPEDTVKVTELVCALPGCPPLETVVAFWTEDGQRRHYKIFKPVEQVVEDDLPPSWMKNALIVPEGQGCECC